MAMIVAITGYIGAGKTTTAGVFSQHGFKIIDVDALGHELLENAAVRERLRGEFGIRILDRNLNIDKNKLSRVVFSDERMLKQLNRITHPFLKTVIDKETQKSSGNTVIDAALYKELDIKKYADKVILVQADVDKIYDRLSPRYTKKEIVTIMNNQKIIHKPDYIIDNNGTIEDLKRRVGQIIDKLK